MDLTSLFDQSLLGRADTLALEHEVGGTLRTVTFREIESRANRLAAELSARDLRTGDRLCVHLANRLEFIDLFLACTRLGVIFVPMNVLYRERELRHIVSDARPAAVVTAGGSDVVYPEGATLWEIEALRTEAARRPAARVLESVDGDVPAMIVYTSGTTG